MNTLRLMQWLVCSLAIALAAAGCATDSTSSENTGSLNLSLELADGITINEVTWTISGGDMAPMSDTIDTSAPGSTASVEVFGLPPGTGYLVELEATDETGTVMCKGDAEFDVEVGVATDVMVMLNCKRPTTLGGVRVNGKFNICAQIAKVIVSPLQTSVGNDIDLSAQGEDVEEDTIAYAWTATGGSIANASAQETTYTCEEVGEQLITISVTDDDGEYCMDDWTVSVTCVEGDGGTGGSGGDGGAGGEAGAGGEGGMGGEAGAGGEGGMGGSADPCEGVVCDATDCTEGTCNPETGLCEDENINEGGDCDGGTGTCDMGICVDKCEGVVCDEAPQCQVNACNPFTGLCETMNEEDGAACTCPTCGAEGVCMDGMCVDVSEPGIAPGAGATSWAAETGQGNDPDGCQVFVTTINNDIFLDVGINLTAESDGNNNITVSYTVTATNPLLPVLGNAAEYGNIQLFTIVDNASLANDGGVSPATLVSEATPSATGQLIGAFLSGSTLTFATPDEILEVTEELAPVSGATSVNVNWDGSFILDLTLGGMPLVTVDESVCTFNVQGDSIDFAVN